MKINRYNLRLLIPFLGMSFMLPWVPGCRNPSGGHSPPPNVLIILTDDMGYGDISCYDDHAVSTPHIDKLAGEGVLCTDFYVPTPYCAPSRATILTGRFPLRHGIIRNPAPDAGIDNVGISDEEVLLGEILQNEGYRTKLIGKWHLGHREEFFPVKHGFDEYYGILYSNDMRPVQIIENMDTVEYPVDQAFLTQKYTEEAIRFITESKGEPFFLHLCHAMPHKPLAASPAFYTPDTPDDLYHDVIRELDWSTGQIIQTLKDEGILENTIIIFMSDNGGSYGANNLPLKGRKHSNWEGGVRVPFIIRYPEKLPSGSVVHTPCWSADIFPTILSMTGIPVPEALVIDGEEITDLLNGRKQTHAAVFTMRGDELITVRKGDWKLFLKRPRFYEPVDLANWSDWRAPDGKTIIAPFEQADPSMYPGVKPEKMEGNLFLFNVQEDISEMVNRSASERAIINELRQESSNFEKSLGLQSRATSGDLKKRVAYVNSYHRGFPPSDLITTAVREGLPSDSFEMVPFFMDTKRNPSDDFMKKRAEELLDSIRTLKPDLLIVSDDNAMKYLVVPNFQNDPLPIVFCGVNWSVDQYDISACNVTGVLEILPVAEVVRVLKPSYPGMKRLLVLNEHTTTSRKTRPLLDTLLGNLGLDVAQALVDDFEEWKSVFAEANETFDIIYLQTRGAIEGWDHDAALKHIDRHIKIPLVTCEEFMMPYAVFGITQLSEEQGMIAAEMAKSILNGASPKDIPVTKNSMARIWINPGLAEKIDFQPGKALLGKASRVE